MTNSDRSQLRKSQRETRALEKSIRKLYQDFFRNFVNTADLNGNPVDLTVDFLEGLDDTGKVALGELQKKLKQFHTQEINNVNYNIFRNTGLNFNLTLGAQQINNNFTVSNPYTRKAFKKLTRPSVAENEKVRKVAQFLYEQTEINRKISIFQEAFSTDLTSAARIVRTESTRIRSRARFDTMENAVSYDGIEAEKQWIATTSDDRTRVEHEEMHLETVKVSDVFSNGLLYPGDPEGELEQIINCRCSIIEIVKLSQMSPQLQMLREMSSGKFTEIN